VCTDPTVAERLHEIPDQLGMHPLPGNSWVLHVKPKRGDVHALPAKT